MNGGRNNHNISLKANRILNIILIALLVILVRVWHLAFIQYDKKLEESQKPQRKTVKIASKRGTIRDRFDLPLAINKIQYKAAVLYSQIREIPSVQWEFNEEGVKVKKYKRKEYIKALSNRLGSELDLPPERIEDLIHSKAALYYNIPFVVKEDLTEEQYYRLKIQEKDWAGLQVQIASKRFYPHGKVGADILGYLGAINRQEYEEILQEILSLQTFLKESEEGLIENYPPGIDNELEAKERLEKLWRYAYEINDYIGKAGIEGRFEQHLRGFHGKKVYSSDARGNYLMELPDSHVPLPGQRLHLTISLELQEFCEQLLAQNERIREARTSITDSSDAIKQTLLALRQPWIKGGAVVAMDPKTGEVLAMASYPRYDPNDFIAAHDPLIKKQRQSNVKKWLESESYLADIWDQRRPLEREFYNDGSQTFYDEEKKLTWEFYLDRILPSSHAVVKALNAIGTIREAVCLQTEVEKLMQLSSENNLYWLLHTLYEDQESSYPGPKMTPEHKASIKKILLANAKAVSPLQKKLSSYFSGIPLDYDKVLLVDLCRLAVDKDLFNPDLLEKTGRQTLSFYRDASAAKMILLAEMKPMAKDLFHNFYFVEWRKANEKEFLKEKRADEKRLKKYSKPYIDYLDAQENVLFEAFWQEHSLKLLSAFLKGGSLTPDLSPYIDPLKKWRKEIQRSSRQNPLRSALHILQQALESLDASSSLEYLKTLRGYSQLNRPLFGRYRSLRKQNNSQYEKHLAAAFYPVNGFGYGRSQAYRQAASQGSIFKLVPAYAALKQKFQEVRKNSATFHDLNPLTMTDQTYRRGKEAYVGYLEDGTPIPKHYKGGRLPTSSSSHLGKMDLVRAIETSSNPYFSLLAGEVIKSPLDLLKASEQLSFGSRTGIDLPGEIPGKLPQDLLTNRTGLYATAIGQHTLVVTPLQTGVMLSALANGGKVLKPQIVKAAPEVQREIFLPEAVRKILLEGMGKVVARAQKESLAGLSKFYKDYPEAISDYLDLKNDLVGKTSTAESVENIDLDFENGTNMYKHVWFGGIAFDKRSDKSHAEQQFIFNDSFGNPELVVVVYMRFGIYGKEAAPLAAQVVQKWRKIKSKYRDSSRIN